VAYERVKPTYQSVGISVGCLPYVPFFPHPEKLQNMYYFVLLACHHL
jgi:hypothetical protein